MVYSNKHPIINSDDNTSSQILRPFEIFENKIKDLVVNISAGTFFNENLYKFNHNTQQQQKQEENKESKLKNNDLPGEFGIPHLSIKSKQV